MISLIEGNGNTIPETIDPKNNICVVLKKDNGSKHWFYGSNIVTNDGDIYYAKRSCGETPATNENFGAIASGAGATCILQNPSSADSLAKADAYGQVSNPIVTSGAQKDCTSAYPKTNDGDSDNTGAGTDVVTYKFAWTTSQIDTSSGNAITGGCIVDKAATLGSAIKILTHWNFSSPASFHKTSTDTLTLYVNHTMNGV
tara:strand:+ start:1952 stop:2551 length:600 start_codon:yes stop_codon:yes gene_type:complete